MLLEELVREATDVPVGKWVETELWHRMGAESDAYWGLDAPEAEGGIERSFAQFYATSRDYARFGQLLLDSGRWRGTTLVGEDFVTRLLTPIAGRTRECDVQHYGYQIWLGTDKAGHGFAVMQGHRGQYIIVVPALDLVVVRTGYEVDKAKENHIPLEVHRCLERAQTILAGGA
jgi:CubicO group peptidase (beta-lactamase class C family)